MATYKCTNCGYEYEEEVHEEPEKCPFCKMIVEDVPDLWEEIE